MEEKFHNDEISLEEYQTYVEAGQTHSIATHQKYYVKKRKYEEAKMVQATIERIIPQIPELTSPVDHYPSPPHDQQTKTIILNSSVERRFGTARSDLTEIRKKYDWIDEEINYLKHYIESIEPTLPEASKNRFATCLSYLKNTAPVDIIQFFHPHHISSSDRLKNGLLRAAKQ